MFSNGFVVENGDGISTSNSYVDIDTANDYYTIRGYPIWFSETITDDIKQSVLVSATLFVDNYYNWAGLPVYDDQALSFPRTGIISPRTRQEITGVPKPVIKATLEAGRKILQLNDETGAYIINDLLPDNPTNPIKQLKEKFDVMETTTVYMTNDELLEAPTLYPMLDKLIPAYLLLQDNSYGVRYPNAKGFYGKVNNGVI